MSYLNGPRINFWGGGSTNVDTANNEGHGLVDLVNAVVTAAGTDEEVIAQLRSADPPNSTQTVASWNYYGDHQVAFMNTIVSSTGAPGAVTDAGDLVGTPVYLLGSVHPDTGSGPDGGPVMVDLDPTSNRTTRIVVGGLQIGRDDPSLLVRENTACHSHFLAPRYSTDETPPYGTPGSYRINGTFQLAFAKGSIVSYDENIAALQEVIEAPGAIGIVVRFSMFEFYPGLSPEQVRSNMDDNRNQANPSLGRIIGTIGPWFDGEPATCPPGRLLTNTGLGGQGLAHLDVEANRLTLDLVSALQGAAIRQTPSDYNSTPIGPNVDYGDLQVLHDGVVLGTTPSLPDSYYVYGGLFDIDLEPGAAEQLAANPIALNGTDHDLTIVESPLRVFSNDRNIYIDEVGGEATIELVVRYLGGAVQSDVELSIESVATGSFPDARFLTFPTQVTVPAGSDRASFVAADNQGPAGFQGLGINVDDKPSYFVNFRKYSADDFSAVIANGNIAWATVYEECLRFYYVIFPAMSQRFPLNVEDTISALAPEIRKRISERYRPTTLYMPLTRSMSPGRVALLDAYLAEKTGA